MTNPLLLLRLLLLLLHDRGSVRWHVLQPE
jgi:hypothetical protein